MCEEYLQRLLERTTETPEGCLEWTGCLNSDGYARVNYKGNTNAQQVRDIRGMAGDVSNKVIAGIFGVDPRTISSIVHGNHWKHIK